MKTPISTVGDSLADNSYLTKLISIILVVTSVRVIALISSELNFHGDEAQYWTWSQALDWGYYTKPPMIAWNIHSTTWVLGDAEWATRISSPLLHAGTSFFCALTADKLYGKNAALWAGITFLTLPAVSFSSCIISTDVPLLFFWSISLYLLVRNIQKRSLSCSLLLGATLGLGLLSKYAMAYFLICAFISCIFFKDYRWFLKSWNGLVSIAIAGLILTPNIIWNIDRQWVTVTHVGDNVNLKAQLFNFQNLISFLGEQFGVFGPMLILALIFLVILFLRGQIEKRDAWLLCFILPVLLIVTAQSFISRANANWAAPAYIGATILVSGWLSANYHRWILKVSFSLHALTMAIIIFYFLSIPGYYPPLKSDPLRKLRGWSELSQSLSDTMANYPQHILLTEDRKTTASLLYGLRAQSYPIQIWDYDGQPDHHYELTAKYLPQEKDKVILAAKWETPHPILTNFAFVKRLQPLQVDIGKDTHRTLHLFELRNYRKD